VSRSINQFLEQVARRGSWFGGGSVAALSTALSAALLEKLLAESTLRRELQHRRQACVRLIDEDATTFARAIAASRTKTPGRFQRALTQATRVQVHVAAHAKAVDAACRRAQRMVKPQLQSDLRCARGLAQAAAAAAHMLIETNRAWLRRTGGGRSSSRRPTRRSA